MDVIDAQEQLHNIFQQIGYRIEASKKFYAIRDDLMENGADYSSEIFRIIDEIVAGAEQQQFIKKITNGNCFVSCQRDRHRRIF